MASETEEDVAAHVVEEVTEEDEAAEVEHVEAEGVQAQRVARESSSYVLPYWCMSVKLPSDRFMHRNRTDIPASSSHAAKRTCLSPRT